MNIAVVGLGPIGVEVAKGILVTPGLSLVAAVDVAPSVVGKPLTDLVAGAPSSLRVRGTIADAATSDVQAVALCTRSKVSEVATDLAELVRAGKHVVTTCEELAAPPDTPAVRQLHDAALKAGVTIFGTGVNPGFVMDRLVLQLAGMCVRVRGIEVERIVDAGHRREPLRRKIGHGLTVAEFHAGVASKTLGHVGLPASAWLIARGLGTSLSHAEEKIEPVVAADGRVLGLRQELRAGTADGRPIVLRLEMSVGVSNPHDRVILDADPPVDARIEGGMHGDRATVAAVLDGLRRVTSRAPRGVVTVVDVY